MFESLFNKVADLKACNFIQKRFQQKCFTVKFAKFLRVPNLEHLRTTASVVFRSSHQRCSVRKGVHRNFTKFTGKHLCQSLFFKKKQTLGQVFSWEFCENSKNTFFYRTPLVVDSVKKCDL